MWKIEFINKNSIPETIFLKNRHTDDFIQFLTKRYGVPKENFHNGAEWSIYKIEGDLEEATELFYTNQTYNFIDLSENSKIKMVRADVARVLENDTLTKEQFDALVIERKAVFSDMAVPVVTVPTLEQLDFGNGLEDGYIIPVGHELMVNEVQLVKEWLGTPIIQWPYKADGTFLGNQ